MHPLYFIAKLSGSFKTCIGGIYMQSAKGTSMTLLVSEWVYRISERTRRAHLTDGFCDSCLVHSLRISASTLGKLSHLLEVVTFKRLSCSNDGNCRNNDQVEQMLKASL